MNNILNSTENKITTITIDRPSKLNALNADTIAELAAAIGEAEDDDEVRVIVLTGSGEKAFVAGADIAEFADFNPEEGKLLAKTGQEEVFNFIEQMNKPVIAAINGFALGGGLELAMACHIRIASSNARMGLPETSLGVIPGYGGTQRLPKIVGKGRALELILTGQMIPADRAFEIGLVNKVIPLAELLPSAASLAQKILNNSPFAIDQAIQSVNASFDETKNGFQVEIDAFGTCFGSDDFKEGTQAFLDKRKANFTGN